MTKWPHGGHTSLPDGGVVRLDFELGRWVATHYSPDMTVLRLRRGNFIDMRALAAYWSAHVCRCASPSEGAGRGKVHAGAGSRRGPPRIRCGMKPVPHADSRLKWVERRAVSLLLTNH